MKSHFLSTISISRQILLYLLYVSKKHRTFYLVAGLSVAVLALEYGAASLMIPLSPQPSNSPFIGDFWNKVAGYAGLPPSNKTWLWLFFILMLSRFLVAYIFTIFTVLLGKKVHQDLSDKIFQHVLISASMSEIYTKSIGYYITLGGDDTFRSGTIVSSVLQALVGLLAALIGFIVLHQFSSTIFYLVAGFLLPCAAVLGLMFKKTIKINMSANALSRELGTTFVEALNGIRSIRSLNAQAYVVQTYMSQIHSYVLMLLKIDALRYAAKDLPIIIILAFATALYVPALDFTSGDSTFFAATIITIRIFTSLGQAITFGSQVLIDIRSVKDINSLVSIDADPPSPVKSHLPYEKIDSVILDNISLGYGDGNDIISNLDYEFRAGHTYSVLGKSGSGKSTLADVILGLAAPRSGRIQVNHGRLAHESVRPQFILVEQQAKIFSSSVRDNLLLGMSASDEQIFDALRVANLDEFIHSLEHGLDTMLTYLGENVSGGQRQRLGIARAILRSPDVLVLDEATSGLDSTTGSILIDRIKSYMKDKILIVITHDQKISELTDFRLQVQPGSVESC